jgi:predicted Zn-dependent peptidase
MTTQYKSESGLTVLLEPVNDVASISAGLWIKTGSRNENLPQYGYAHFVEHMLFKGTSNHTALDIAKEIDRVGGQHNAATNREYTCYYINVVSDYLELAVSMLADMYHNSLFDLNELDKEKNVIIEEIRMYEDTPDEFIHDIFIENMFSGHPLSHPILGTIDGIDGSTRDLVYDFYDRHYRDDNSIFVIAGSFDEARAKEFIDTYFTQSVRNGQLQETPEPTPPERIAVNHIEKNLEQVHFCLGSEGIRRSDSRRWALYSLSTILGGNMSSRLFQNVREDKGICYSIYSFHSSYSDYGIFGIYCATSPDKFKNAVELIVDECRDVLEKGITEDELQDAKTFMKGSLALSYESIEVRMGQLAKNEMTHGRIITFNDMVNEINQITLDDIREMTAHILEEKKLSIVSVGKLNGLNLEKLRLSI